MDSEVNQSQTSEPQQQRSVQVRNRRRKNGTLQYNVVYQINSSEKGKWLSLEDIQRGDPEIISLVQRYDEVHPFRKYQQTHSKGRKIIEIVGLVKDNQEPRYVVKFEGSDLLEAVNSNYLYKYNKAILLDFFESKIQFDYSKTQVSNPNDVTQPVQILNSVQPSTQFNQNLSQSDPNIFDQKKIKQPRQKTQNLKQQQQMLLQMIHIQQPQMLNNQICAFPQSQQQQIHQMQQSPQMFYPQGIPMQSYGIQSNLMLNKMNSMNSMLNFQNPQQPQFQIQGNQ